MAQMVLNLFSHRDIYCIVLIMDFVTDKKTAYEFSGKEESYVKIPFSKKLDTRYSMTVLASIFPVGKDGPIIHYSSKKWGVHLWQYNENQLFARFVKRNGIFTEPLAARVLQVKLVL